MKEIVYNKNYTSGLAPTIKKNGALRRGVEHTPIVINGDVWLIISIGEAEGMPDRSIQLWNPRTGEAKEPFGEGFYYPSAYMENGTLYVFATEKHALKTPEDYPCGGNGVWMFKSTDLENWTSKRIIESGEKRFWNSSVCKGRDCYIMAVEVSAEKGFQNDYIGHSYTSFFARSYDLENWEMLPDELSYTPKRYNACPAIRYLPSDDKYYMICLEAFPCARYAPYIYRTTDFETWEVGIHNPIMMYDNDDRKIKDGISLSDADRYILETLVNNNCSDIDFCEFEGKTYICYANGDQHGRAFICEAVYDGSNEEFLKSFFK